MPSHTSSWFAVFLLWTLRGLFGLVSELSLMLVLTLAALSSFAIIGFVGEGVSHHPNEIVSMWEQRTR